MQILWILVVGVLLSVQTVRGATPQAGAPSRTFYVDARGGDDARDGMTPETAWRSLEKVNRAALHPGDKVLFRRGQTWRGQLRPQSGDASGVITYGTYGEGPKPLLLGSVAMDRPEDWQPAAEGIWATAPMRITPVAVQTNLEPMRWQLHQEAGAACTLDPLSPEANGPAGYRLACRASGTAANHIQLIVAGLSLREGEYYLLTFRARSTQAFALPGVSLMKAGAPYSSYADRLSALPTLGAEWAEYAIPFRAQQTANDARITVYLGGALPAGATLSIQPRALLTARCSQPAPLAVDVGNIIFDQGQSTGFKKWREPDLREEGDYFYDASTLQVKLRSSDNPAKRYHSIELALNKHIIDQGGRGYVTYEDLALRYGAAHGIGGGSTQHITVRNCDIAYIGGGHQFTRPDGHPVRFGNGVEFWADARDCLVEGCRLWEIYDAALTNQGDGTNVQENITYRRNVIWNCEYSFEYWNRGPASHTRAIRFEHNTCVNAGFGWGYRQRPDPNGRHLMFYDNSAITEGVSVRYNIFCNAKDSCLRLHGRDWTASLNMDYNCWFQSKGSLLLWGNEMVTPDRSAEFLHKRGLDPHSIVAEPGFVDPARNDYRLAPNSPARQLSDLGFPAGAMP
ncbi:MAG: hypothetical protein ACM359_21700 [Bacillota bacterium]